jgi:hypothetical protein
MRKQKLSQYAIRFVFKQSKGFRCCPIGSMVGTCNPTVQGFPTCGFVPQGQEGSDVLRYRARTFSYPWENVYGH